VLDTLLVTVQGYVRAKVNVTETMTYDNQGHEVDLEVPFITKSCEEPKPSTICRQWHIIVTR